MADINCYMHRYNYFFVEPAWVERYIVVAISVWCMCVCVHVYRFVRAITSTFMHGFQNNLAQ